MNMPKAPGSGMAVMLNQPVKASVIPALVVDRVGMKPSG